MSDEHRQARRFGLPRARQAALDRLARAYADDDIELPDYERRATAVQLADNLDELRRIMDDVPDFDVSALVPGGSTGAAPVHSPSDEANASAPEASAEEMRTALQILGNESRRYWSYGGSSCSEM